MAPRSRRTTTVNPLHTSAVALVRVSKRRDEQTSISTQREAIQRWADAQGVTIVRVIVEEGRSAYKRGARPDIAEAVDLVRAGAVGTVVAWRLDRVGRSARDLHNLTHELDELGARLVTVSDSIDTSTHAGRIVMGVLATVAELESDAKSERAAEWHDHRRRAASVPAARPPRGYRRQLDDDGQAIPGTLVVDPLEGPLIAEAARRVLAGASVRSVRLWLHTEGVTISQTGLTKLLRSPTISGLVEVTEGRYAEGAWEALVSDAEWRRLGALLDDPSRKSNFTEGERRWALPGIAKCHCGGDMRVKPSNDPKRGTRLTCKVCETSMIHDAVETFIVARVLAALDDRAWRALRSSSRGAVAQQADVERKLALLWQQVLDGELDPDQFREAKLRWEGELAVASTEPKRLPDVASVRQAWPDLDVDAQHLVLRAAVSSLVIGPAVADGRKGFDDARVLLDLAD